MRSTTSRSSVDGCGPASYARRAASWRRTASAVNRSSPASRPSQASSARAARSPACRARAGWRSSASRSAGSTSRSPRMARLTSPSSRARSSSATALASVASMTPPPPGTLVPVEAGREQGRPDEQLGQAGQFVQGSGRRLPARALATAGGAGGLALPPPAVVQLGGQVRLRPLAEGLADHAAADALAPRVVAAPALGLPRHPCYLVARAPL